MEKKIWKSLLGKKHLLGKTVHFSVKNTANNADTRGIIQQFFQHLYRTANSIVHLMVRVKTAQILWYRQQYIYLRRIQLSRVVLMDISWLNLRQHKFTDTGNSIFLQERSSTAAKFSEGFTPYSLFFLNCREQQGLKTRTSCENSLDYSVHVFSAPKAYSLSKQSQFQKIPSVPKSPISFKKSRHFLPAVTTIKVSTRICSHYNKIIPT